MAIGERIHFFRMLRGLTQKQLGNAVGFREGTADVRIAQYETGTRTPKAEIVAALAKELDVSTYALTVPEIDSDIGLMHTLFTLEDIHAFQISQTDGELCIRLNKNSEQYARMHELLTAWRKQAEKLEKGEITQEEYNRWRRHYPEYDNETIWAKVPSKNFSEDMARRLGKRLKDV